jgi:hypothetical protein
LLPFPPPFKVIPAAESVPAPTLKLEVAAELGPLIVNPFDTVNEFELFIQTEEAIPEPSPIIKELQMAAELIVAVIPSGITAVSEDVGLYPSLQFASVSHAELIFKVSCCALTKDTVNSSNMILHAINFVLFILFIFYRFIP